jgi:arylsulfatase A-like enzyme
MQTIVTARNRAFAFLLLFVFCSAGYAQHVQHRVMLILIDGLRPDQITQAKMPNLYALQQRSVVFGAHHSIFPTVTRVNASTIATGTYPDEHGILSNLLYMPQYSATPLSTGESRNLILRAADHGDHILARPSLSEAMAAEDKHFVAITSGTSGAATLLAPEARHGQATLINAGLADGKVVAYPAEVDQAIRAKLGVQPAHEGLNSVLWTQRVLREYILPELPHDLVIDWMTEPDTSQHKYGVGSPQAVAALKAVDAELGKLLATMRERNELASTDILITADHGFGDISSTVDLRPIYKAAGLQPDEITALNDGPTSSFYVHPHDAATFQTKLRALTEHLAQRDDVQLLFTRSLPGKACKAGAASGSLPGTFALEKVHLCTSDGPDLVVSMRPTGQKNAFGELGSVPVLRDNDGPDENAATHGGLNPWMEHIPLICTGPDFTGSRTMHEPSGNIDITATMAALLGIHMPGMDGRNLASDVDKAHATGSYHYTAETFGIRRTLNTTTYLSEEYVNDGER